MITKRNIFLILFIILLFSASVYAGDFSGNLTYSGQYNFTEQNLSNTLNLAKEGTNLKEGTYLTQ